MNISFFLFLPLKGCLDVIQDVTVNKVEQLLLWLGSIKLHCYENKKKTKNIISRENPKLETAEYNQLYFFSGYLQTSTPDASMAVLCFKYMGQTWPSNRPGGSGTA